MDGCRCPVGAGDRRHNARKTFPAKIFCHTKKELSSRELLFRVPIAIIISSVVMILKSSTHEKRPANHRSSFGLFSNYYKILGSAGRTSGLFHAFIIPVLKNFANAGISIQRPPPAARESLRNSCRVRNGERSTDNGRRIDLTVSRRFFTIQKTARWRSSRKGVIA